MITDYWIFYHPVQDEPGPKIYIQHDKVVSAIDLIQSDDPSSAEWARWVAKKCHLSAQESVTLYGIKQVIKAAGNVFRDEEPWKFMPGLGSPQDRNGMRFLVNALKEYGHLDEVPLAYPPP
jgi:hypothetical protein